MGTRINNLKLADGIDTLEDSNDRLYIDILSELHEGVGDAHEC